MKILLLSQHCIIGGVERFVVSLSGALRAGGHQCELFFFQHGPMEQQLPTDCVAHFGDLGDLMRLVSSRQFDVVHAATNDWHLGVSAVRSLGARLVVTAHTERIVPSWNSGNCDVFAGCSRWLAEAQQAFTDLPTQVVLNGIDTDKFRPDDEIAAAPPPIVAWVGRGTAVEHKRIDAFGAIAPALHNAGLRLWLAEPHGSSEVETVAPDAARTLRSVADFWAPVAAEKMPAFFREVAASGGCVVSTSSWEGLPLTLLEAQACGCPVIGADVRGVNECVNPARGGVLYPLEMPTDQLAKLVVDTLRDTGRMLWRRQACAEYAREQFSLERMVQNYLRLYHNAPTPSNRIADRVNSRLRLSPLVHWEEYVEHRWGAGRNQYDASRRLAARGDMVPAAAAARAALATSPTIYVRPERLVYLLKTLLRSNFPRRPLGE